MLRILAIGLLLAHSLGADLGCVSNPQLELQLGQQSLKPSRMSTGFHAHTHLLARQRTVELLRLFVTRQPFFLEFSVSVSTQAIC